MVAKLLGHRRHGAGLALVDALGGPLAEPSIAPLLTGVSRTRCGALMLPDRSRFGPLYWAVLERTRAAVDDGEGAEDVAKVATDDEAEEREEEEEEEDDDEEENPGLT